MTNALNLVWDLLEAVETNWASFHSTTNKLTIYNCSVISAQTEEVSTDVFHVTEQEGMWILYIPIIVLKWNCIYFDNLENVKQIVKSHILLTDQPMLCMTITAAIVIVCVLSHKALETQFVVLNND